MKFPRRRKTTPRSRRIGLVFGVLGIAGYACTFPDYEFTPTFPDTCSNGIPDGDETEVDCGGSCKPCPDCEEDEDCEEDAICVDNHCRTNCDEDDCDPTCDDGITNGDETGVDCGGSCPDTCAPGQGCENAGDCTEGVCEDGECQEPTCSDRVRNGGEPSIDCGAECEKCEDGERCDLDADCESGVCADDFCAPPECANGEFDPDIGETDTDCGGDPNVCARCSVGQRCEQNSDCKELVCDEENEECLAPTCSDKQPNGSETDVDCGGTNECDRCQPGQACKVQGDCEHEVCSDDGECLDPECDDMVQNGEETDRDCGGPMCRACGTNDRCLIPEDCADLKCDLLEGEEEGRCAAATCSDQLQNGDELGLDCGNESCGLCELDDTCSESAGCASYLCEDNRCKPGLSLAFNCGQCGAMAPDHIKFTATITNTTDEDVNLGGVSLRYYLSLNFMAAFEFECSYGDKINCGTLPELKDSTATDFRASQYIEVNLASTVPDLAAQESVAVLVTMRWPMMQNMTQTDDYSFFGSGQDPYSLVPLFRDGSLIWGDDPE